MDFVKLDSDHRKFLKNGKSKPNPIPKTEKFQVRNPKTGGIDEMSRPHDPAGGAVQNVQCSCVVVYVSESYARRLNSQK